MRMRAEFGGAIVSKHAKPRNASAKRVPAGPAAVSLTCGW